MKVACRTGGPMWLGHVDGLLEGFAARHGLVLVEPAPSGSMGTAVFAEDRAGDRLVVKAGIDPGLVAAEHRWLAAVGDPWVPPVGPADVDAGVFSVAFVDGGIEAGRGGDGLVDDAITWLESCPSPDPDGFDVYDVARFHATAVERIRPAFPVLADRVAAVPPPDPSGSRVGHGDFSALNTFASSGGVVAIDPWPGVAPVAADAARWVTDPRRGPGTLERLERFAAVFGDDVWVWALHAAARHLGANVLLSAPEEHTFRSLANVTALLGTARRPR